MKKLRRKIARIHLYSWTTYFIKIRIARALCVFWFTGLEAHFYRATSRVSNKMLRRVKRARTTPGQCITSAPRLVPMRLWPIAGLVGRHGAGFFLGRHHDNYICRDRRRITVSRRVTVSSLSFRVSSVSFLFQSLINFFHIV